jgi:hypothetical protein
MNEIFNLFVNKNDFEWNYVGIKNCLQRTGLCAGWEIEFRLPVTAAD